MKKKVITIGIILLIISFIFALLFYNKFNQVKVTASELSKEYSLNKSGADKKYLDKDIIVTGKVKAFYKLLGSRNVLELQTGSKSEPVFCFFFDNKNKNKASRLMEGEEVNISAKCAGTNSYSFVKGVKLEVDNISK